MVANKTGGKEIVCAARPLACYFLVELEETARYQARFLRAFYPLFGAFSRRCERRKEWGAGAEPSRTIISAGWTN
jgi:hypothetical protein